MSTALELSYLATQVQRIAEQAGIVIMPYFSSKVAHELKGDGSPVSQADYAADCFIRAELSRLTPDIPILSEETADDVSQEERLSWSRLWLVDPLDGTKHFIRGDNGFSVNIALIDQGKSVLGVVYAPSSHTGYSAFISGGAWQWQAKKPLSKIHVSPIADKIRVVTGAYATHQGDKMRTFLANLGNYELTQVGSALKVCLVAEGKADVYPRYGATCEWDTAASQIILEEAGGVLVDTSSKRALNYNQRETLKNNSFIAYGQSDYPWSF